VGKQAGSIRIAMIGMGAANFATYGRLKAYGINPSQIVACDSCGILHRDRHDVQEGREVFREKWLVCAETNPDRVAGGIGQALRGADVCIAFARSDPTVIQPPWIGAMARDAIVFACANPEPEIWPRDAKAAGARVVATGRGDFPNQLNNSLVFPGVMRGTLDSRASTITDDMAIAAATELALCAEEQGLREDAILPRMDDWQVVPRVAAATALKAQEQGLTRIIHSRDEWIQAATERVRHSRRIAAALAYLGDRTQEPTRDLRENAHPIVR
jgi:malate dehydrogenase (oxaloacetate-decarboxylating)